MKKSTLFLVFLSLVMAVMSGCTGSESAGAPSPVPAPTIPAGASPADSSTPPAPATAMSREPAGGALPDTVTTGEQATRPAADNPYLEHLYFRKKTFDYSIPDCLMQDAFPAIAKDPLYGIRQPVPKLTALHSEDYEHFLREYTAGKTENTPLIPIAQCAGADGDSPWNFVETRVILNPTNVRPANYSISLNVRSEGKVLAQFRTTRTLVIDQKITLIQYIPLATDDLDLFDSVGVTYTRLPD